MRIIPQLGLLGAALLSAAATAYSAGATVYSATPTIHIDEPYTMTLRILNATEGLYQVEVDNMDPLSFIRSYVWTPPGGLTVVKVTSSFGGTCSLQGGSIRCSGDVAPPGNIGAVGGGMIVDFTATGLQPTFVPTSYGGYFIHYGVLGSVEVETGSFADLPLCKKGETSTRTNPCTAG